MTNLDGKPIPGQPGVKTINGNQLIQQFIAVLSSRLMYTMITEVFSKERFVEVWNNITSTEKDGFLKAIMPMIQGDIAGASSIKNAIDEVCKGMGSQILSLYLPEAPEEPDSSDAENN